MGSLALGSVGCLVFAVARVLFGEVYTAVAGSYEGDEACEISGEISGNGWLARQRGGWIEVFGDTRDPFAYVSFVDGEFALYVLDDSISASELWSATQEIADACGMREMQISACERRCSMAEAPVGVEYCMGAAETTNCGSSVGPWRIPLW